ncbi:ABC transporter permease [Parabacteroides faecis]|uniref:ABC transporter permease n=1 Tax=Parabacteroides faecis TaxID=1217282 RepID=UPI003522DBBA
MKTVALKLVFRSWWRNKTFSIISIVSLAIGIACTNLLTVFTIHEYGIENENPNKERIWMLNQDSPMESGKKIWYADGSIPPMLKENYSEVKSILRISNPTVKYISIDNIKHAPICLMVTDSSLTDFFPYKVLSGNLKEALTQPDKLALTEPTARKLFGNANPIGKIIHFAPSDKSYQVAAIIADREQSFLHLEAVTGITDSFFGGPCLLLMNQEINRRTFEAQLKKDKIPTLQGDVGSYCLTSLQESYFQTTVQRTEPFFNRRQPTLLYVGLISALLILLVACFNYINLNFSRLLQQMRMIHTQKLMGASRQEINRQLFLDTFLTVIIAFSCSLLITHDLLPAFNSIVNSRLHTSFFFNWQTLPVICGFILLLSVVPAAYMGRKISGLSGSGYREFFTGNKKRKIVTSLSIAQYVISIGLIIATLTVNNQLHFIRQGGDNYKNLIEMGDWEEDGSYIRPFVRELKKYPEIAHVSIAGGSVLNSWIKQVVLTDEDGKEKYTSQIDYFGESDFLDALQLKVRRGLPPDKAIEKYERPAYVNEKFVELLVTKGEDPIGKPLNLMDKDLSKGQNETTSTIAGIVDNLYTNTLEKEVNPITIQINNSPDNAFNYIYIRLNGDQGKALATIREVWDKVNPGQYFTYRDVYKTFLQRNEKTTELSRLLLMYSVISIFLTCFGLFGMALYATEQRTKEIGVRKVNGATTPQIMLLLNRQFIIWIGIAFIIAIPITWLLLNRWLENFVYRTDISIGIYLISGLFVLFITLLTVSWHSYKAASANPVKVLRSE